MSRTIRWIPPTVPINYQALPALEKIRSQGLLYQSQMHKQCRAKDLPFVPENSQKPMTDDFQNLEWLGDAVLSHLSTDSAGEMASSAYRVAVGLHDFLPYTKRETVSQPLAADLFEAYIGALYKDAQNRGEPYLVRGWLEKLWAPAVFPNLEEVAEYRHLIDQVKAKKVETSEKDDQPQGKASHPDTRTHKAEGIRSGGREVPAVQRSMVEAVLITQMPRTKGDPGPLGKNVDDKAVLVDVVRTTTKAPTSTKMPEQSGPVSTKESSPKPKENPKVADQACTKPRGDQPKKAKIVKAKKVEAPPAPAAPAAKSKKKKPK